MNKNAVSLNLLMVILGAFACVTAKAGSGLRDEVAETFAVKPGGVLNFDADLAEVEITTNDSETVRVEFMREFKVESAQEADELRKKLSVEMTQSGNTVKVTVRFAGDQQQRDRNKVRLAFRIAMPRKFNLELRTAGSAEVGDLDGSARASTLGGSLQLGSVSGPVTATSKGGTLSLGDVGGDLEARAAGGSVKAGRVNGKALAMAEGGSVSIAEASEIVEASAEGGSVKASISRPPRADLKITAHAGSIDLRLPASAAVTVDAACTAGVIHSDFKIDKNTNEPARLKGNINGGGQLLTLRATAGSISLRK